MSLMGVVDSTNTAQVFMYNVKQSIGKFVIDPTCFNSALFSVFRIIPKYRARNLLIQTVSTQSKLLLK